MRRPIGFLLLLCAYALLYPGLTQPVLSVSGTIEKADLLEVGKDMLAENESSLGLMGDMAKVVINNMQVDGNLTAFDKTRSILGTVQDLFQSNNQVVALLIITFSVFIPVIKGFATLISLLHLGTGARNSLQRFSLFISKWSMADVFVIGILVAFLAVNGIREDSGLVNFDSILGPGFYFFLGYCLLSIAASQLIAIVPTTDATNSDRQTGNQPTN